MARRKPFMGWYDQARHDEAKAAKAAERWGVFPWEAANMYRTESAVRIYRRETSAQAYADKVNDEQGTNANLVVRKIR